MKTNNLLKLGVSLLSVFVLAACSSKDKTIENTGGKEKLAKDQTIALTVAQEMPSADLSKATDTVSFTALNNVYEGLYRVDQDNVLQPAGAKEKAKISSDGLTYTIKLRQDAKWSNGDKVKASDYVFAWQRTLKPEIASEYASLFFGIENAEAINTGAESDLTKLGVKALDDETLEIKLAQPVPYMEYLFAFPSFFPQNEAVAKAQGDNYSKKSENAVYNGPFVLKDFDGAGIDTQWTYEKNPNYWDKDTVKLEKASVTVVKDTSTGLNLFQSGKADDVQISGEQAKQMQSDPAFKSLKEGRTSYIELNQYKGNNQKLYSNKDFRKALSYALDREGLVENILGDGSVASTGLIPKDMSFDPKSKVDFAKSVGKQVTTDSKKAKAHWEKAKKALNIKSAKLSIIGSDNDDTKKVMEKIQSDIEQTLPDVKVEINPVPFSVRLSRSGSGDFDMVLGGWGADYADPSSFTDLFVTDAAYNRGHYSNPDYDKLVKKSQDEDATDPEKRWEDLKAATEILVKDDMGVIPVYQRAEAHLVNTKVKGMMHYATGPSNCYKWTYVVD